MIRHEALGRWYYLSFDGEGRNAAVRFCIYAHNIPHMNVACKQWCRFNDLFFETELTRGFGINSLLTCEGSTDGYLVLRAEFTDTRQVRPIAEHVSMLLGLLNAFPHVYPNEFQSDPNYLQLYQLQSFVGESGQMGGCPLGGDTSVVLKEWVRRQQTKKRRKKSIEKAIFAVWNACASEMFRKVRRRGPHSMSSIEFMIGDNGSFMLQTIGNTCDVSTVEWWQSREGEGHHLDCHNLDSPIQQMSLLAGLAALHDMASEDIDRSP